MKVKTKVKAGGIDIGGGFNHSRNMASLKHGASK